MADSLETTTPISLELPSNANENVLRNALLMSSLSGRSVALTNIRSFCQPSGLNKPLIAFIELIASFTNADVKGCGLGSTTLVFSPQEPLHIKKSISLDLQGPYGIGMNLVPLVICALYQQKKITISAIGSTHGNDFFSVDVLREHVLKPLHPYAFLLTVTSDKIACQPDGDGQTHVVLEGKHALDNRIPSFSLQLQPTLISIRACLIASKELFVQNTLEHVEDLLHLSLSDYSVPVVIDKQYVQTTESSIALCVSGLFGSADGYDNDTPWIKTINSYYDSQALTQKDDFDTKLYADIAHFKKELTSTRVDAVLAEQLLPLIALQGGKLVCENVTSRLKDYIFVFEQILSVTISIEDNVISSKGFASSIEPEVWSLDEL